MKAFGANSFGQLGIGHQKDVSAPENCIFEGRTVVPMSVACGSNHSLVISTDDELWVSGLNDHGQIGLHVEQVNSFVRLRHEIFVNMDKVAAGWSHSLVLLKNGDLYALGSNDSGQCGVSDQQDRRIPTQITGIPKLLTITCGLYTSYALDIEGNIWGWGQNKYGELGIPAHTRLYIPRCIVENGNAKDISCGQNHLLFFNHDGKIFGIGSNRFGQLGQPIEEFSATSSPIPILHESKDSPYQIFSGWNFSGCVMKNGRVYMWGRCDMGQLACQPQVLEEKGAAIIKKGKICDMPLHIESLEHISHIAAGSEFCLALNDMGALYCWGWNEHGNCGCGHNKDVFQPLHITSAAFISAGYGFSFIR